VSRLASVYSIEVLEDPARVATTHWLGLDAADAAETVDQRDGREKVAQNASRAGSGKLKSVLG
jgi:hypothetical protein